MYLKFRRTEFKRPQRKKRLIMMNEEGESQEVRVEIMVEWGG
jgi:hypothetical protein